MDGTSISRGGRRWKERTRRDDRPSTSGRRPHERPHRQPDKDGNWPGRRPPGLTGREIGLYYRNRARERRLAEDNVRLVGEVIIPEDLSNRIRPCLENQQLDDHSGMNSAFERKFMRKIQENIDDRLNECSKFPQDADLDRLLHKELVAKQSQSGYKRMFERRQQLPAYKMMDAIVETIENNQIVIISGETGCGKTTQVGQFILDHYITQQKGSLCRIVCSQPRRISAIAISERVAEERDERLGVSSGYHIRLESSLPRKRGSITFCTTGIILRQLEGDVTLSDVSHLILDEIHERDVQSDFLLALVKKISKINKGIKLILMSATLNSEKFAEYFGVESCVHIPGFTYEVEEYYLEDVLSLTGFEFDSGRRPKYGVQQKFEVQFGWRLKYLEGKFPANVIKQMKLADSEELNLELILQLMSYICRNENDPGAILVFLPGYGQIADLTKRMAQSGNFPSSRYIIIPLHSQMPSAKQRTIFQTPPPGVRKIVLSTQIAETSITIDDVVFVIDCARLKQNNFDVEKDQQTLLPEWVTKANADQRRGRAGRVKPGICYHLFSRARLELLEKFQKPEVLRMRLETVVLDVKRLQLGKSQEFLASLMDPPDPKSVEMSVELLKLLDALDSEENLTPLGYHLSTLPVNPRMGKMILLGAIFSCLDPILSIAASLDYRDPFLMPLGKEMQVTEKKLDLDHGRKSDHLVLCEALKIYETTYNRNQFCNEYFLCQTTLRQMVDMKRQFAEYLKEMNFLKSSDPKAPKANRNSNNDALIKAIVAAGLYPNIVYVVTKFSRCKHVNKFFTLTYGRVKFHPRSVLEKVRIFESSLLVYFRKVKSSADFLHDASMIQPLPVLFFGHNFIQFMHGGRHCIAVGDNKFAVKSSEESSDLLKKLRLRLNEFLGNKVCHPGPIDWEDTSTDVDILRAIMALITVEENFGFTSQLDFDDDTD